MLKGRSNYLCRQRVAEVGSGGIQPELGDEGAEPADEREVAGADEDDGAGRGRRPRASSRRCARLVAWSQTSATGDRADLSFEPSDRAWTMVSVGPRECPGAFNCPSGGRCFAEAARDRAAAADVVVVNTHLYGAHLASGGAVLPEHDVVVFDEAHELEEVMTSSLGVEVTPGRFRALVTAARSLVEQRDADLLDALAAVGRPAGRRCWATGSGPGCSHEVGRPRPRTASWPSCSPAPASSPAGSPTRCGAAAPSAPSSTDDAGTADPDRASRKTRTLQAAAHLAEDLHRLVARTDAEVAWVDGTRRNVRLRLSPIDVGPALAGDALGRGHRGADQRHHPAAASSSGSGSSASRPRSSTWAARSTTAPTRCSTSPATCPTGARRGARRRCTRSWRS